jgi:GNAT superfamily N-acetyltransferase
VPAVRLSVITRQCLRLEFSPRGEFVDAPSVVARTRAAQQHVSTSRIGATVELRTACVHLRVINDGLPFHPANTVARITWPGREEVTWRPGDVNAGNLGGTVRTLDGVRGPVDLGEGLLSRDGWYLLDDSASPIIVDGWPAPRPHADEPRARDWYLFAYAEDYHGALRSLAAFTGAVSLPRRAMLGSWYSRFWPYRSEDFKQIVEQYRENGVGLDVLVFDMDWHRPGWTGWSWNRELIPDPSELIRWLHERNLTVALNLHPANGVAPHEDAYPAFMRALGRDPTRTETAPFDPADRAYMHALRSTVLGPLLDDGVDLWWVDWQQHQVCPSLASLSIERQIHAAFTQTAPGDPPLRPGLLSRWAGWGDQRHGVQFSGDAHAGWPSLAFQVAMTVTAGNVLCCFWSHDIGGHFGARDEECVARWVQFGAVSAALRLHSARAASLDRRPWTHAPGFAESMRRSFALRSMLMPTIYSAAARCAAEASPLLRPMYFDHPRDERGYDAPDQYMLGDLLAAPVSSPGMGERRIATRRVWLPTSLRRDGVDAQVEAWHDWFTGAKHPAGAETIIAADIDEFPLFAPAGVPVLLAPPDHPMGSSRLDTLVIRVFPARAGHVAAATLIEDDGTTMAYTRGQVAKTLVTARFDAAGATVTIEPTDGAFDGQPSARAYIIEWAALASTDAHVSVDGQPAACEFSAGGPHEPPLLRVRVPARAITQPTVVRAEVPRRSDAIVPGAVRLRRLSDALGEPIPDTTADGAIARLAGQRGRGRGAADLAHAFAIGAGLGVIPDLTGYRLLDASGLADHGLFTLTVIDEHAGDRQTIHEHAVVATPGVSQRFPDPAPPLAAPPIGVRASRIVRSTFTARGRPRSFETRLRTLLTPIQSWRLAGPYAFDDHRPLAEQRHAPELRQRAHWRTIDATRDAPGRFGVDLTRHTEPGSRLAYAAVMLAAPRDLDADLTLESAESLEAWHDGVKVFSMDPRDTMDSARGVVRIRLHTGLNHLMLKVSGGLAGFAFTAAIDAGTPLTVQAD